MSQLRTLTEEEAEHKRKLLARDHVEDKSITQEQEEYYTLHPIVRDFHELMEG